MFPVASFRPSVESVDAHCTLHICMTRIFGSARDIAIIAYQEVRVTCRSECRMYFSTRSPQICSDAPSGTYGPAQRSILRFQTIVSNSQLVESFVLLRYRFITLVHVLLLYAAL